MPVGCTLAAAGGVLLLPVLAAALRWRMLLAVEPDRAAGLCLSGFQSAVPSPASLQLLRRRANCRCATSCSRLPLRNTPTACTPLHVSVGWQQLELGAAVRSSPARMLQAAGLPSLRERGHCMHASSWRRARGPVGRSCCPHKTVARPHSSCSTLVSAAHQCCHTGVHRPTTCLRPKM